MKKYVSLWAADLLNIVETLDNVDATTDGYHIDVMDGHFVNEIAFGIDIVRGVRAVTTREIDVHLMVVDAPYWAGRAVAAGASVVTVHRRSTEHLLATLNQIVDGGASASLAIEIGEDIPAQRSPEWRLIDRILIMATPLGMRGQPPHPETMAKLRRASETARAHDVTVFVDGGVNWTSIHAMADAGADGVIAGSIALRDPSPAAALREIESIPVGLVERASLGLSLAAD